MNHQFIYTSLTRISDLAEIEFNVEKLDRDQWETGDYVVSKILDPGSNTLNLELITGRMRRGRQRRQQAQAGYQQNLL